MPAQKRKPTRDEAKRLAWERGLLAFKVRPYQRKLYSALWAAIEDPECLKFVLNVARRFGKSTILVLIAMEYAIRNPNSQIRFAAPTAKALKKITNPIFKILLQDCPQDLKPQYKTMDNVWIFPNGSEIHMAGTDNGNYDNLRGTTSNLNLIDEAGFCDELEYVLSSVLMPQTLTTGGTTLLASTPPKTPAHDFFNIAQECEMQGNYAKFTVHDNESLTPETIELYQKESGGEDSTTYRREYLVNFVVDEALQLIPEWRDEFIQERKLPEHFEFLHKYVSMDIGVRDYTAILYGYYDFMKAQLVIQKEDTLEGYSMTTQTIKSAIIKSEKECFQGHKPFRRIADNNNLLLLNDLGRLEQIWFNPTDKDSLEAMVNAVRTMVNNHQIIVDPSCKKLIGNLKYGVWDKNFKGFGRSTTYKHFDHLAALMYMVRNLAKNVNPIPANVNKSYHEHFMVVDQGKTQNEKAIQSIFKGVKKN